MNLSIIICTHNSNQRLGQCLKHLAKQKISPKTNWEILVCDYMSKDGTAETVEFFSNKHPNIFVKFIKIKKAGKTPALLAGFYAAQGEAVCIVDDDNLVDQFYLNRAHNLISKNPEIGVIGAYGVPLFEKNSNVPEWFDFFKSIYAVGHQFSRRGYIDGERYFFWGAGSVIRKSAFLLALKKGFVPLLNPSRDTTGSSFMPGFTGGEDPEMCFAILMTGHKLWYEPELKYHHQIPNTRLTKKFIYDTTRNVHVVQPYLRLFMSHLIKKDGFRNKLRIIIWQNWFLHIIYIILSLLKQLLLIFINFSEIRIKIGFTMISAYNQLRGLFIIRTKFISLKNNFRVLFNKLGET